MENNKHVISDETLVMILRTIQESGGITRTDLIAETRISQSHISSAIRELREMRCIDSQWQGGRVYHFGSNHNCWYCK